MKVIALAWARYAYITAMTVRLGVGRCLPSQPDGSLRSAPQRAKPSFSDVHPSASSCQQNSPHENGTANPPSKSTGFDDALMNCQTDETEHLTSR
ncbi:hypothetical protein TNCV_3386931 [Trichonephila clavipes]|nr:hypothetical protein TNCV_3386931 [Trichonephila clavipes]